MSNLQTFTWLCVNTHNVPGDLVKERFCQLDRTAVANAEGERQSSPYNLLMTDSWMLLVPRSQEFSHGISVNALGYVGSLFVKDQTGLDTIRRIGPMNLLREVSVRSNEDSTPQSYLTR